jgi:hypothetical protein
MMTPFEFCIYLCGACGFLMVGGAIWLLRTGIIKLSEVDQGGGSLSVDIANKIKISTAYPALGLFIIGLLFLALPIWFSRPIAGLPLNIVGQIDIDDPSLVTVSVEPDTSAVFKPDSDGRLDRILPLAVQRLKVVINAAGYKPQPFITTLKVEDAKKQRLAFNNAVKFIKLDVPKPAAGKVDPLPVNVKLDPLQQR